jgi:hypothetical protein
VARDDTEPKTRRDSHRPRFLQSRLVDIARARHSHHPRFLRAISSRARENGRERGGSRDEPEPNNLHIFRKGSRAHCGGAAIKLMRLLKVPRRATGTEATTEQWRAAHARKETNQPFLFAPPGLGDLRTGSAALRCCCCRTFCCTCRRDKTLSSLVARNETPRRRFFRI